MEKVSWRRILLKIEGVLFLILGVFLFLSLSSTYVFMKEASIGFRAVIVVGTILITLLLVFTGVSLIRRNRHGGWLAGAVLLLGMATTLSSYILKQNINLLGAFLFYTALLVFLILGWRELK